MIHPTRSNLLLLKDKVVSVTGSIDILVSRRQALIMELLQSSTPYLESRKKLRLLYGEAIAHLQTAAAGMGEERLQGLSLSARRDLMITIRAKSLWGLPYKDITAADSAVRRIGERGCDYRTTAAAMEEAAHAFERIIDDLLALAEFDNKIQRLGREIRKTTRRMRVLEEKVLPQLQSGIRAISHQIAERERESHYRLKEFKRHRARQRDGS